MPRRGRSCGRARTRDRRSRKRQDAGAGEAAEGDDVEDFVLIGKERRRTDIGASRSRGGQRHAEAGDAAEHGPADPDRCAPASACSRPYGLHSLIQMTTRLVLMRPLRGVRDSGWRATTGNTRAAAPLTCFSFWPVRSARNCPAPRGGARIRLMIRNMAAGDVDALTAIEVACFAAGYADKMMTREDFAEVFDPPARRLFCAVEGGEVAGYAFLLLEDGAANFDSLAVSPAHQGKGLGRPVVQAGRAVLPGECGPAVEPRDQGNKLHLAEALP